AAELDIIIEQQMNQNNIPGLSASIVKDGQVVWMNAYGMANVEENIEVSIGTNFTLASISKLFTAAACAQLWENGVLDIDANINNYLPFEVVNPNHPETPITTRQLLTHKSSLQDSESDLQTWDAPGDPIYTLPYFCENYFVEGGEFYNSGNWGNSAPGNASYWYSNAGFTLLGLIVQEASNQDFNVYCREQLLDPLGMPNSGWFYSEVDSSNIAMPYNGVLQPYGYFSVPEYPAAMLKSNIVELSRFLLAITQGGHIDNQELISENTFNAMLPESMTNGFGWWGTDTWYGDPEGNFWSHGGFMNGVRTQLNYYPESESGLIILTNGQGNYTAIQNALEDRM
ncbi:MAG: serine hydrolase domain-containing protein, partial [Flavobacteriales bacterium]